MAMRSVVGMLKKALPRRVASPAPGPATLKKPTSGKPEKVLDDEFLEEMRQIYMPWIEESKRRTQEELRAYKRKARLRAIATYGFVGYLGICAYRALPKN